MNHGAYTTRRALTLLEVLAAIVVMSVISVVLMPVVTSASESYTVTRDVRARTERVGYALDRISRIVRQAPIGVGDGGIGVVTATNRSVAFSDGTGFGLNGSTLEMLVPGTDAQPLCQGVDELEILYLDDDGVTSSLAVPTNTHRFVVTVTSGDLVMSVVIHPRIWIGQEST